MEAIHVEKNTSEILHCNASDLPQCRSWVLTNASRGNFHRREKSTRQIWGDEIQTPISAWFEQIEAGRSQVHIFNILKQEFSNWKTSQIRSHAQASPAFHLEMATPDTSAWYAVSVQLSPSWSAPPAGTPHLLLWSPPTMSVCWHLWSTFLTLPTGL